MTAAGSVNRVLRAELAQKDVQIVGLTRLVDPPFSLRFLRSARVALRGDGGMGRCFSLRHPLSDIEIRGYGELQPLAL